MTVSLRQRVLLWIVAIHVLAFAVEFALFGQSFLRSTREEALDIAGDLVGNLRSQIKPGGDLNAANILSWSIWTRFDDAILLDRNLVQLEDGSVRPQGIALNPLGSSRRPADFDYATVYSNIFLAERTNAAIDDVAGGRVLPIQVAGGVWGACWYRVDPSLGRMPRLVQSFLVMLGATTLALATTLFFLLRREVLDPVSRLTSTARRVAAGDLSARVAVSARDDELGELSRSLNAMVAEVQGFQQRLAEEVQRATEMARSAEQAATAERRLAATGKLAAGVAHEINNPLGGLLNAVERLKRDDLPSERRAQYFALLSSGLERIRDTVGKLLRLTPRQSMRSSLNLSVPTLDAIGLVRHRAARAGVTLTLSDGRTWSNSESLPEALTQAFAELPRVQGDANELGQAVLNLLVNALDALESVEHDARRLEIVMRAVYEEGLGPAVALDVHDNGPGAAREELPKLIDPFYTTKDVGKGTGLGLSMVHSVVTGHGGRLVLDSEVGRGFHVHVALPQER